MTFKILGITGSPIKKGNVESLLQQAFEALPVQAVAWEIVNLSTLKVKDCIHCNFCLNRQQVGKYCSLKDDAQEIFEKAEAADILVLASPVYFMRTSARMAALLDRFRVFIFGNLTAGRLKNKIGASLAAAWLRQGGLELTHLSHITAMLGLEMIPASLHKGVSPLGASILTSPQGSGNFDPEAQKGGQLDEAGLQSARLLMRRALELARLTHR